MRRSIFIRLTAQAHARVFNRLLIIRLYNSDVANFCEGVFHHVRCSSVLGTVWRNVRRSPCLDELRVHVRYV